MIGCAWSCLLQILRRFSCFANPVSCSGLSNIMSSVWMLWHLCRVPLRLNSALDRELCELLEPEGDTVSAFFRGLHCTVLQSD